MQEKPDCVQLWFAAHLIIAIPTCCELIQAALLRKTAEREGEHGTQLMCDVLSYASYASYAH